MKVVAKVPTQNVGVEDHVAEENLIGSFPTAPPSIWFCPFWRMVNIDTLLEGNKLFSVFVPA